MQTRKQYQTMIWTYEKRRAELIEKYGYRTGRTIQISNKIRNWRRQIRIMDGKSKAISDLIKKVNQYFDVDISDRYGGAKKILARKIYFKYGMENKIDGNLLSESIGFPKRAASRSRREFTKSFKTNPCNKEEYHKFKTYITNQL